MLEIPREITVDRDHFKKRIILFEWQYYEGGDFSRRIEEINARCIIFSKLQTLFFPILFFVKR